MRTCEGRDFVTQLDGSRAPTGPVCGHPASRHYDVRKLGGEWTATSRCVIHDLDVYWKDSEIDEATAELLEVTCS